MRVLGLQHISCEHPGVFRDVMRERGVEYVPAELDEGDPLPDWREFDAILCMGGPMGVGDEAEHPWLVEEKRAVREAVQAGRPFLGVCLGVQMLAASLGARVWSMNGGAEVGLLPVTLTEEGRRDPLLGPLEDPIVTLQWHGDTFDLPEGAALLASSPMAPHQAFRWGERAWGVQFHLEVTGAMAREWDEVPAYRASLRAAVGEEGAAALLAEVEQRAPALGDRARALFARWLDAAEA